ncbi:MAG: glycosyltransferase [Selenomonas sp.]|uniref:glycosyltransferase n=1 Tax=Selenomonas sp. TaxID=2053611 RepID=UPI0025DC852D|nr:glycosyltransferase [Selenomonas sp.]MCR5756875.1 glycosyltransferase [Selenomonas sp.]
MNITIITVVYNAGKEIIPTIEAVLNQTIAPYEYLFIDGASRDNTLDIIESYKEKIEQKGIRYKVVSEPDKGLYDAMNKGVKLAEGNFIVFANAGDWLELDAVKIFMDVYQKEKYDFAYGSIGYICKKRIVKKSRKDRFISSRNWNHPSSIVRKELYLENPFDLKYSIYADFDWFLKMRKSNVKITILPSNNVISNFRIGGASINDGLKAALKRANEKYMAYISNDYSRLYCLESYGWEFIKYIFAKINTL